MKHLRYLRYVIVHKWFVLVEGRKLGVPLGQLVAHDWQKFLPVEWFPYVETFYGDADTPRRADGGYDPNAVSDAFDRAWLHHQKVGGKHHWQYWVLPKDDGTLKALAMPDRYRREMLADWRGAGRALGSTDTVGWYHSNRNRMTLHPDTRAWVEEAIGWAEAVVAKGFYPAHEVLRCLVCHTPENGICGRPGPDCPHGCTRSPQPPAPLATEEIERY